MRRVVKWSLSYVEIRTVDNILYHTLREACFAPRFSANDSKYIKVIKEANDWGSRHYLRKLFVTMLFSINVNKPED